MPIPSESPEPKPATPRKVARSLRRFLARDTRDHVWGVLDALDARPALKRSLYIGVPVFAVAAILGVLGYQRWARTNSIRIARQWLDAGRLDRAEIAVQDALAEEPEMPASWRLASELAWKKGSKAISVGYARKAAALGNDQADDVLAWAEAAILADDVDEAHAAMAHLDPAARTVPRALRVAGELERRGRRFSQARDDFERALQGDMAAGGSSLAVDEVPLGIVCLQTGSDVDRARGRQVLSQWKGDPQWGADALRALLGDAMAHREMKAAAEWAEELRANPRCTLGDVPVCLRALAESDPEKYQAMLAPMEEKSRTNPNSAAQLMGWLIEIGKAPEAVRWGETLDRAAAAKPPIAVDFAEALRATHQWASLQDWVRRADWGPELGFMGWAYGLAAARSLGDGSRADSLWHSLYADAQRSPAHALFAGDSLYSWGYPKEAAELLWAATDRPDLAYVALGSLARMYQVQHDAVGQYRAFSRLNEMRPTERNIANNLAYFAALTDQGSQTHIQHIAEDNYTREPSNVTYRATYAFVLDWVGQPSQAMTLLEPVARQWRSSRAVAFAYGATLAALGRKAEARQVFDTLDSGDFGPQERAWIQAALR